MKVLIIIVLAMLAECVVAIPSSNNFHAVTNDWYNGNYSNVYELAQLRLAVNSNDLVAANILVEYDVAFSDFIAMSNSIRRLMRVSDVATSPAYTNLYWATRPGWVVFLEEYLPAQRDDMRLSEQLKSLRIHKEMLSRPILDALATDGAW